MDCNVGPRERIGRILMGLGGGLAAYTLSNEHKAWRVPLGILGGAALLTGLTRYCMFNRVLGINNCEGQELIHFKGSEKEENLGARLNRWQQEHGFTVEA